MSLEFLHAGPYIVREKVTTVYTYYDGEREYNCLTLTEAQNHADRNNFAIAVEQAKLESTPESIASCTHELVREVDSDYEDEWIRYVCPTCGRDWIENSQRNFWLNNRPIWTHDIVVANPDFWAEY